MGIVFVRCYGVSRGILQQHEGEIGTPIPPSCRHRGTPELSSAMMVRLVLPLLSSSLYPRAVVSALYPHDRRVLARSCLLSPFFF